MLLGGEAFAGVPALTGVPALGDGEAKREKMESAAVEGLVSFSDDNRLVGVDWEEPLGREKSSVSPILRTSICERPCELCRLAEDMIFERSRRGCSDGFKDQRTSRRTQMITRKAADAELTHCARKRTRYGSERGGVR